MGRIVSRSDVPVGVALSGGLDSSVVAALIARNSAEPVHAFTVGYQGHPANDERAQARELATTLGLRFHEIELDEAAVVTSFPALVRAWDDPIADMSGFGYQAIARLVQQHGIRVLVQGHGGDELFWGYPWVRRAMDASLARAALWQRSWRALPTYASSALPGRCGAMEEVLGLVFEPHSDDMAHAASRVLVPEFVRLASEVRVWDPLLPGSRIVTLFPGVSHQPTVEHAVDGAGVVVVLTEFSELTTANWRALTAAITDPRLVIDCKNCLDPGSVTRAGLRYQGIGRTSPGDGLGALPAEELPAAAPVLRPTLHA